MKELSNSFIQRAREIRLLLTDVDGVLTDTGVFVGPEGELMKRFSIRDGMGVERLRKLCDIETGIITGEASPAVMQRAKKLQISELHLGVKNKLELLEDILHRKELKANQVAYIGDDTNDLAIMQAIGLKACPGDAMIFVKEIVDYECETKGGFGAFREFAEQIIRAQQG